MLGGGRRPGGAAELLEPLVVLPPDSGGGGRSMLVDEPFSSARDVIVGVRFGCWLGPTSDCGDHKGVDDDDDESLLTESFNKSCTPRC